jgi:hypothetical protein
MSRAIKTNPAVEAMIEAEVREALRPYEEAGVYPPEVLAELRHMLRLVMRTHPIPVHLLEQLRPRAVPDESGKEDTRVFSGAMARVKKAEGE